jgi:hypothetical protein
MKKRERQNWWADLVLAAFLALVLILGLGFLAMLASGCGRSAAVAHPAAPIPQLAPTAGKIDSAVKGMKDSAAAADANVLAARKVAWEVSTALGSMTSGAAPQAAHWLSGASGKLADGVAKPLNEAHAELVHVAELYQTQYLSAVVELQAREREIQALAANRDAESRRADSAEARAAKLQEDLESWTRKALVAVMVIGLFLAVGGGLVAWKVDLRGGLLLSGCGLALAGLAAGFYRWLEWIEYGVLALVILGVLAAVVGICLAWRQHGLKVAAQNVAEAAKSLVPAEDLAWLRDVLGRVMPPDQRADYRREVARGAVVAAAPAPTAPPPS